LHKPGAIHVAAERVASFEQASTHIRCFQWLIFPSLLQSPEYTRSFYLKIAQFPKADIKGGVEDKNLRTRWLENQKHLYTAIVSECVFWVRFCNLGTMLEQIGYLRQLLTKPNIRLFVLPFNAVLSRPPFNGFYIYDDFCVRVPCLTSDLQVYRKDDIERYFEVFEQAKTCSIPADHFLGKAERILRETDGNVSMTTPALFPLASRDAGLSDYQRGPLK
jgi:hypothetical protein